VAETTAARRRVILSSIVIVIVIAAGISIGIFESAGSPAPPTAPTSWLLDAKHAIRDPTWQCQPYGNKVQQVDLPGLGKIDNICVHEGAVVFIQNEQQPNGGFLPTGVIYSSARAMPRVTPDACVAHLDGPWWRYVPADPNCPGGYTVIPGG
jgi:hypothetical protein